MPLDLNNYIDKDVNKVPLNLSVNQNSSTTSLTLTWVSPTNTGAISGYNIYSALTDEQAYNYIGATTGYLYIVSGLETSRNYFFAVTTVYSGAYPAIPDYSQTPTGLTLTTGMTPLTLQLTWFPPVVTPVSGYRVWRTDNYIGNWAPIGITTGLSFTDSGLSDSYRYYYRLTSLF